MDCDRLLERLHIAAARDLLTPFWTASAESLPTGRWDTLDPAQITAAREFASLPSRLDAALHEVASRVTECADLRQLAWHFERLVYEEEDYEVARCCRDWPQRIGPLGHDTGLFYLLIALAALRRMRAFHSRHAVPEDVTRATCSHYAASLKRFRLQNGRDGFGTYALYWLRNHTSGRLYCLGRLEFMVKPFAGALTAWRHRSSGQVIALAAEGVTIDADGLAAIEEEEIAFTTAFEETADDITGHLISPSGFIEPQPVTLERLAWKRTLAPGDLIYEVHIPDGGGMTLAACRESMQQATEFFPRYFPAQQAVGFACTSWILNPQLAQIYRPDSNMVLWQRELYLYPIRAGDRAGLFFVFGTDQVDPQTGPRDTSLRRAMLDHLAAGGRLIGGGMFLMLEDFEHFGESVYRRSWPARGLES